MSAQDFDWASVVAEWNVRVVKARQHAHGILATHERSTSSRVIILEDLLAKLSNLPVDVEAYFREAVVCLENNLTRAAIVLSWSGLFHVLAERLLRDHDDRLRKVRSKWAFRDLTELKENYSEFAIIEASNKVGMINNAKLREFHGMLSKRNQCAHPTLYRPSINTALGFVDDAIRQATDYM